MKETAIHVEGVRELFRTLRHMEREASDALRDGSGDIARRFLSLVQSRASTDAEIAAAQVLRVYRDRIPKVGFPAGAKVPASGTPRAGDFFYGTEFGGRARDTTRQFRAHTRTVGYWFYPTLRAEGEAMAHAWFDSVADVLDDVWNRGAARAA